MLRQIQYFQAVVRNNSFSQAAEECHISQSAISQQIKGLEAELGFLLLERKNRKFVLTPAGEYFYKKSLLLMADYEQLCREATRIAQGDQAVLKIGCLRGYGGKEVHLALDKFAAEYPRVSLQIFHGNHEDLFQLLRSGAADLVFNDQRRAFSDEYVNLILSQRKMCIEISLRNAIAALPFVTTRELRNLPCILIASKEQWETEQEYFRGVIGYSGEFLRAENLEEGRMLVVSGQGFLPGDDTERMENSAVQIRRVPLYRGAKQIDRNYCLFWKKDNSGYYIESFADILKNEFR